PGKALAGGGEAVGVAGRDRFAVHETPRPGIDLGYPGDGRDLGGVGGERDRAGIVHEDLERVALLGGEVRGDLVGHDTAVGLLGQGPLVGDAEADAEQRGGEHQDQRQGGGAPEERAAHDDGGEAVPATALDGPRRAPQLDARPPDGERGGQHQDRADGGGERHHDARVGERAQEGEGHRQEHGEAGGDGDGAEQNGAPGGGDGAGDGRGAVPGGLLAVAVDDEEAVVDGQAHAHDEDEVGGEGGDLDGGGYGAHEGQ